ncbi:SNF2 family N-terminal domain-containing protein [Xylariaceae sp. FL1019]|nr:SNF2 family N-terminal domain-containing protein [Xylariaceae sp. FL1019]
MSRLSSPSKPHMKTIPATPKMSRAGDKRPRPDPEERDYINELSDGDLEGFEVSGVSVPCSSPYFTQPTQVIGRGTSTSTQPTQIVVRAAATGSTPTRMLDRSTQPTQITGRNTLQHPSSPSTAIEVPASSPFQQKPHSSLSPFTERKKPVGTIRPPGSFMAPAGTDFRPPGTKPYVNPNRSNFKSRNYLNISEDELQKGYEHADSSGDESPMRGHIEPSSFTKPKSTWPIKPTFEASNIRDLAVRHATNKVYKIVSKAKPTITLKACHDAVVKYKGSHQLNLVVSQLLSDTIPKKEPMSRPSTLSSFSSSTALHTSTESTPSASTKPPPRRRLVQGTKRRSPSPPPVFSVSSSASSQLTTPDKSEVKPPKDRPTTKTSNPEFDSRPRRPGRLRRGRRNPTPPPTTITVDSDSDSDPKLPPPNKLVSRKRKATPEIALVPSDDEFKRLPPASPPPSVSPTRKPTANEQQVLQYLNTCTPESLSQITGYSAADSRLMTSSRPFSSISEAEIVSKKNTAKAKSRRTQVGSLFVEKLTSWFEAFTAASEVIKECEGRGRQLQQAMAKWSMDKNGRQQTGTELQLPITEKPKLMADGIALKSYQLLGLNWMNLLHSKGFSGILADDMGLGKTCQVISMIAHLVGSYDADENSEDDRPWPVLIVVPPSVCENWMAELERFAPELTVCPYIGSDRRSIDPEEARENHVVLTSYSQVERQKEDLQWLRALEPYAAIFDEGHKLKNRKNLVYKQMMRVPTHWRLILSGTPVQNNLKELLTLLHFVEPDLFGDEIFDQLDTIFEAKVPNKEIHNFAALAKERVSNARKIMEPFILQRRKEDVLDLAKKIERNVEVEMHPKQKAIYDEVKGRYLVPKTQRASSTIKDQHPWLQLRKASIHHQLFRVHFTDQIVKKMVDILWDKCSEEELYVQSKADRHKALFLENYREKSDFQLHIECKHFKKYIGKFDIPHRSWEESPKVQKLLELVRGYMKTGDRVLIFSRFDLVIDILRETFAFADIPYCELTGATDISDRFPEIERFNNNPDIPVFLLTTGAGGTGLNLTAANKIIIFDQSDNPQDDVQASNRAHRIGQTRDVEVIRLITKGSVEGLIFNSCVKKLMLARVVEGNFPVDEGEDNSSIESLCRQQMIQQEESTATQPDRD